MIRLTGIAIYAAGFDLCFFLLWHRRFDWLNIVLFNVGWFAGLIIAKRRRKRRTTQ